MASQKAQRWNDGKENRGPDWADEPLDHTDGATQAQWNEWRRKAAHKQGWKCAICKGELRHGTGGAVLDHCHVTGNLRAVLCAACNSGLGMFKDDPIRLASAIQYLLKHARD